VEQRQGLEERVVVPVAALIDERLSSLGPRIERMGLIVDQQIAPDVAVMGERFLLRQAFANLLDNALDFTPAGGVLRFAAERESGRLKITLFNSAESIPDYALPRLSERFYSLPRPGTGRKSTGLGLNFVEEVVQLHGGQLQIGNADGGVLVVVWLD
jgi:two-component system sensor histidine kinase CreC